MGILQERKLEWVAMPSPRGIIPTQGSNPCLISPALAGRFFTTKPPEKSHMYKVLVNKGFPGGTVVKNLPASAGDSGDLGLIPGLGKFPWSREWQSTPVFLPGKFHGQRAWWVTVHGVTESDMTERLILQGSLGGTSLCLRKELFTLA